MEHIKNYFNGTDALIHKAVSNSIPSLITTDSNFPRLRETPHLSPIEKQADAVPLSLYSGDDYRLMQTRWHWNTF